MMRFWLFFGVLVAGLASVGSTSALAQTRNRQTLEKEKKQNQERLSQLRTILKETSSQRVVNMGKLRAISQEITTQAKQINLMTEDVRLMETEITELRTASDNLTGDLTRLRKEYADMVYAADRRRQQLNPLGFLFSAQNFNQLVARYRYLKQYSDARQGQVRQMQTVQTLIQSKQQDAERKRKQRQGTLVTKVKETKKLETLKTEQGKVVAELSQKESELRTELEESKRAIARLEGLITRIIEREARERAEREARERAERERLARLENARKAAERRVAEKKRAEDVAVAAAAGKPAPPPIPKPEPEPETRKADERSNNNLNTEETALASSFAASRSRLPWPVAKGFVSDRFGIKPHPVLKGIKVENLGVDIQTNAGEPVRAVYDGSVVDVESVPGMNTVIAVQHGNYMTVYAKLRSASVRIGQRIKARETIGTVATGKDGVSEVQFQIWKNAGRLNPESWLTPR
jgi:murein hydrolase activator